MTYNIFDSTTAHTTRVLNRFQSGWLLRLLKGCLINLAESLTDYLEGADKDERAVAVGKILGLPPSKCFDETNNPKTKEKNMRVNELFPSKYLSAGGCVL